MGLIASLINVVMPAVSVIVMIAFFFSQFSRYPTTPGTPVSTSVFPIVIVAVLSAFSFAGIILFLVSMNHLSRYYNAPAIFKNVLYGFILSIITGIVFIIVQFVYLSTLVASLPYESTAGFNAALFAQLIFTFIAIFAVSFVISIITAVLYWRALTALAEKSGVESFKTAGLLYLIGAVLTIVVVGGVLIWIAWILLAMAFNSLKTTSCTKGFTSQSMPSFGTQKFCPYCGAENYPDAIYCKNCGKQI
jgi:uncharacterized membrane protein